MVIWLGIYFYDYRITDEALLKEPGFNEKPGFSHIDVVKKVDVP